MPTTDRPLAIWRWLPAIVALLALGALLGVGLAEGQGPSPVDGGGPGYGYVPAAGSRVCWQTTSTTGGGPLRPAAYPWGIGGNEGSYGAPAYPDRLPIRYAGKPPGATFCGWSDEAVNAAIRELYDACVRGDFGPVACSVGSYPRGPTWQEVADWQATHGRNFNPSGEGGGPACPSGFDPHVGTAGCTSFGGTSPLCCRKPSTGHCTRACLLPPPPEPPAGPPEPPAGPPEGEGEPPTPPPADGAILERLSALEVALAAAGLRLDALESRPAPVLPPCGTAWVCRCEEGVTP